MKQTIVLYPAPGIGHIVSMVELSKQLLLHFPHHHYSFTILLTTGILDHPSIDTYIHRISTSHPSISFLRFPSISVNPSPTLSPAAKAFQFIRDNATNVTSALTTISNTTSSIKAFIIDMFCASAMSAASSMGIPVFCFFTSGAAVLALYTYFPTIHNQTTHSFKNITEELHIPGNAPLKGHFMPEPVLDRDDPAYWDMLCFCNHLPKYNGIIVNTFQELEPNAVNVISEGLCFPDPKQRPHVYYIGPLIAEPTDQQQQSQLLCDGKDQCLSWLEKQPSKSVVYLCFGSRGTFSVEQLKEIADGLEKSGKRFLWVVKRPIAYPNDEELELGSVLPMGFLERTKGRGLVVKSWVQQVEVLSCDSVGVFVSHCGWNSVLESVVAGVPMIAWPLYAEQHVNRNVMVGDMKVAVGVEQREGDGFVSGEEVEKRVREVMESEKGKELRENSLKMNQMALAAFGELGSSKKALQDLAQTWTQ